MENSDNKTSLLDKWKNRSKKSSIANTIEKAPEDIDIPLSPGQKRLWFLQQLYPENPFYNYSETYTFTGNLNTEILTESLKKVYLDHDVLRTTYQVVENSPIQIIDKEASIDINLHDFSNYKLQEASQKAEAIQKEGATGFFDLTNSPLVRASIIKVSEGKHILQITLHHIVTDKWSMGLFRDHVASYYLELLNGNKALSRRKDIQYSDYSYWLSKKETNYKALNYWKQKLSGNIPQLTLPFDFDRPQTPSFKGKASFTQEYSPELSKALLDLSKTLGTTPYNVMLAVYYIFLYRCSGQTDVLVGTPVTNRDQKDLEDIVGFFNDTLVLRVNIDPKTSFANFVSEIKNTTLEAFENKDLPFDVLVKEMNIERSLSTNPFFQVMFLYHSKPDNPYFGEDLTLSHTWFDSEVAKFDLTIYVGEDEGILSTTFEFAHDLFEESTINRFQEYFKSLLENIVDNLEQSIGDIPMLTGHENKLFFNPQKEFQPEFNSYKSIHKIIEDITVSHPTKQAVTFNDTSLTYNELNTKANILAQNILNLNLQHNAVIGLCIDRSLDMIVGMLSILKAGGCYLPLDPNYPKERIDFIVNDSNTKLVITQQANNHFFENTNCTFINIEDTLNAPQKNIELPEINKNDLAYIIYTSGSTGKPKGVPISHGNIISSTASRLEFYDANPDAFLLMSSISFDSSKAGIFWTLCTGGNLVIAEKRIEQDIDKISNLIGGQNITHTLMLPSLYKLILDYSEIEKLKPLTNIIVAGEACSVSLCKTHLNLLPKVNLYNEYGPTEGSVWCIAHKVTSKDLNLKNIPIGKSIANSKIYILDKHLKKVPLGVSGEIYIGGSGLSNGYINRPKKTNEVFITNPSNNERLYKTGDLAYYNKDGNIIFLGRADEQIKIRGFRVELSEIENIINKEEGVDEAIVLHEKEGLNSKLIAFIKSNNSLNIENLKSYLKSKLPDYMLPNDFYVIESFPFLPNGKVDKNKLKDLKTELLTANTTQSDTFEAPKTDLEKQLVELWGAILGIHDIGINDNFFNIGGDSILSIQFIAQAKKTNIKISPNLLFENQTIKELAKALTVPKTSLNKQWSFVTTIRKGGNKNPLFCIHSGGGHVFFYGLLKDYLKNDRPIYALQPSGLNQDETMHDNVELMAKDYLKVIREIQPKGPYNILVYCFSTSVGNEMSILLEEAEEKINVIVIDTMASAWNATDNETLNARTKFFFKRLISSPFKTIKLFFQERYYLIEPIIIKLFGKEHEKELEKVKANLRKMSVDYKFKPHNGNVSLILTKKEDKKFEDYIINSWEKLAKGGVEVFYTKGHHTTLFEKPDVEFVSKQIDLTMKD